MTSLAIVNNPFNKNYNEFFKNILLHSPKLLDVLIFTPIASADKLNFILNKLYDQIRKLSLELGFNYNFDINILINQDPKTLSKAYEKVYSIENEGHDFNNCFKFSIDLPDSEEICSFQETEKYDCVALGGTFDHIHDGHKVLLSLAIFLTKFKLIIGITGPKLLTKKKYAEFLHSFDKRVQVTIDFFRKFAQHQIFEIYEINDICGPTGYLKDINCLVLSEESKSGGDFVNEYRQKNNYPQLEVFTIGLIGGDKDTKLSSTDLRRLDKEKNAIKS